VVLSGTTWVGGSGRTARITGAVYGPREQRLAGVNVRFDRADTGATAALVTTDSNGTYAATVPTAQTYNVTFTPAAGSGLAPQIYYRQNNFAAPSGLRVGTTNLTGIDAMLATGYPVSGRVTNRAGAAMPAVTVRAFAGSVCCHPIRDAVTDETGAYSFELAAGYPYKLQFAPGRPEDQWFNGHNNPGNDVPTAWNAADAFTVDPIAATPGTPGTSASCSGVNTLLDSGNTGLVPPTTVPANPPSFTTTATYCVQWVATYHWNGGAGISAVSVGLQGTTTTPIALSPATGTASSGSRGPVNWQEPRESWWPSEHERDPRRRGRLGHRNLLWRRAVERDREAL
jgi:hypothetical protein